MSTISRNVAENVVKQGKSKLARLEIEKMEKIDALVVAGVDQLLATWKGFDQVRSKLTENNLILNCREIRAESEKTLSEKIKTLKGKIDDLDVTDADSMIQYNHCIGELGRKQAELKSARDLRLLCYTEDGDNEDIYVKSSILKKVRSGKSGDWAFWLVVEKIDEDSIEKGLEEFGKGNLVEAGESMLIGTSHQKMARTEGWEVANQMISSAAQTFKMIYNAYRGYKKDGQLFKLIQNVPNPVEEEFLSRVSQGSGIAIAQQHYEAYSEHKKYLLSVDYVKEHGTREDKQKYVNGCIDRFSEVNAKDIWSDTNQYYFHGSDKTSKYSWSDVIKHWKPDFQFDAFEIADWVDRKISFHYGNREQDNHQVRKMLEIIREIKTVFS